MTEQIMNIEALQAYFVTTFQTKQIRVREADNGLLIEPVTEVAAAKKYICPLRGIAKDSNLTVEKFLEWKREEREREYEQELHS
jgi:hypothetical protein